MRVGNIRARSGRSEGGPGSAVSRTSQRLNPPPGRAPHEHEPPSSVSSPRQIACREIAQGSSRPKSVGPIPTAFEPPRRSHSSANRQRRMITGAMDFVTPHRSGRHSLGSQLAADNRPPPQGRQFTTMFTLQNGCVSHSALQHLNLTEFSPTASSFPRKRRPVGGPGCSGSRPIFPHRKRMPLET